MKNNLATKNTELDALFLNIKLTSEKQKELEQQKKDMVIEIDEKKKNIKEQNTQLTQLQEQNTRIQIQR